MSIYPPNQTTPGKGSNGYVWNWLSSPMQKFAATIASYLPAPEPPAYSIYTAKLFTNALANPEADVLQNTTGLTINWLKDNIEDWYYYAVLAGVDPAKLWINNAVAPTVSSARTWTPILNGYPGDADVALLGYLSVLVEDLGGATGVKFEAVDPSYAALQISDLITLDSPLCIEIRIYP